MVPVRLCAGLALGQSLSQGAVSALIVTPPKASEAVSLINQGGREAGVLSVPTREGFDLTLTNFSGDDYVLVYGAGASAVSVDDHALPQLDRAEMASMPSGWCRDTPVNRILVRLPRGPASGIKVKFALR